MRLSPCLFALLLVACEGANVNSFFTSDKQKNAVDQLLMRAQFEFDQGKPDKALEITDEIMELNPYEEKTLILRSYSYLSLAGLDPFKLSKNLIEQSEAKKTTQQDSGAASGDSTTDNLSSLATVLGISNNDLSQLGTANSDTGTTIYYPKTKEEARKTLSGMISNINKAVAALCPLIPASYPDDPNKKAARDSSKDDRHECSDSPFPLQGQAQSLFAWALAHLGEAITFYSVVLYDEGKIDPKTGKPAGSNLQFIASSLDSKNLSTFITQLNTLTDAINAIFPTDPALAKDSMLNALFADLQFTSLAFGAIEGVPESVTKSINDSITNLQAKIDKISSTSNQSSTATAESTQNEAIRNALTTGAATKVADQIKTIQDDAKRAEACALYKKINSDPTKLPAGCS